ncbi:MAG: glycoside hydrolase family 13 protein [Clostridia bacterium]|nr:glycoside hydrolase family 13 protein [Clostridia bacterium]
MIVLHDSRDPFYRTPSGARPAGEKVTLRLRAEAGAKVFLRVWWNDAEKKHAMKPSKAEAGLYEHALALPKTPGLLWYYFIIESRDGTRCYGNAQDGLGGEGQLYDHEPPSFQITVYDAAYAPPEWMKNGIMYQIMPDRFFAREKNQPPHGWLHENWDDAPAPLPANRPKYDDSADDFFGGNLNGIAEKLDYLRDLGVTVLYLNPIFRGRSNHKYDTGDYETIDPSFGTQADFEALCAKAKEKGIRVMLDGVFSHTGNDSRYFNRFGTYDTVGAYQSPASPYASWYTFKRWPDDYDCWWGFQTLPNVNELDPGYMKYIVTGKDAIVKRWLRRGAAGWRLDVADELPMAFLRALRKSVKATDPDAAVLGEVWEDASNKIAYGELRCYCAGDTLDSVMNYPLREGLIDFLTGGADAFALKRRLDALYENYPAPFAFALMNLVGSHDKARILNRLSGAEPEDRPGEKRRFKKLTQRQYALGRRRFLKLWAFMCALPGMPCLFYGDEAGAQGGDDPFCRCAYPWGREDTALLRKIAAINHARLASPAARLGDLQLVARDADTIEAVRRWQGEELRAALDRRG